MSAVSVSHTAPSHHPHEGLLLDYATGALDWQRSVVLACHLALCPQCARAVADLEAMGGALMEQAASVPVSDDLWARTLAGIEGDEPGQPLAPAGAAHGLFPPALQAIIVEAEADRSWRRIVPGLRRIDLGEEDGVRLRLMRISAGCAMPHHSHGGDELTLVLEGGFHDETGAYGRGDLAVAGPEHSHRPIADADGDCVCLVVEAAPARLSPGLSNLLGMLFPRRGSTGGGSGKEA